MKSIHNFPKVYLHRDPVDGRKMINGLAAIVETAMGQVPSSGALFAFTSRRRDTIKLLYWDRSGFALWMKKLEEEAFRWPLKTDQPTIELTAQQLSFLLDGYDILRMKPHKTLSYVSFS